jgi:hypothetical protein
MELNCYRAYGARDEVLFVIRPDGYIGYRSEPANPERLEAWLATIFKLDAQPPKVPDQPSS